MLSTKTEIRDRFSIDEKHQWKLVEDASESKVDGVHILARIAGPMFLVNGSSKNERVYTQECWDNARAECKSQMENGGLLGTVGHDQAIDEQAILDGKITHAVTKLWYEGDVGMGEMLIFNTPGGRILNTLYRAGVRIPVSSRAYGSYSGKNELGEDIIDPQSFTLKGFDCVLDPGVDIAYPGVVESAGGKEMDANKTTQNGELIEKLSREKIVTQQLLDDALTENKELRAQKLTAEAEVAKCRKVIKTYIEKVGAVSELTESVRKWSEQEPLKLAIKGSVAKVSTVMGLAESYAALGTTEEIKSAMAENKEYRALGSVKLVKKLVKLAEAILKLGKPDELAERLKKMMTVEKDNIEKTRKENAAKIAKRFSESEKFVEGLLAKMTSDEVIKMFKEKHEGNKNLSQLGSGKPQVAQVQIPDGYLSTTFKNLR